MVLRPNNRLVPRASSLAMALGYFLLASISLRFTRFDGGAAFVWPAGPLLFSALTVVPRRRRLSLTLWCLPAMALASSLFGLGWRVAGPLAFTNVGEAYAAAFCVRRAYPRFGQFRSAKEIFWFVAIAGMAVPAVFSMVGGFFVHLAAHAPYWTTCRDWFTAHAVGLIAFGPLMTFLLGGQMRQWAKDTDRRKALEAAAILFSVAVVATITFGQGKIPLLAAPFLPMMLATLRLGRFGAVSSIVIMTAIGSACSLAGIGPTTLVHGGMGLRLQVLQIYFATVVLVILPTAGELTARRRGYERLSAMEALNRLMLDHSSDIILRLSVDGIIQYVSPAIRHYEGLAPETMVGQRLEALVHENDRSQVLEAHRAAVGSVHEIFPVEWQADGMGEAPRAFEAHARAIVGKDGKATGVVYVARDVTERNLRSMELEVRANTDPLTGLVNRRVFDLALDAAIAAVDKVPASLAIFDLDHFKLVNDRHGHASGDIVLTRFAEILRACTRDKDVAARLGGEEFAVILHRADHRDAEVVCERIRHQLARSTIFTTGGTAIAVTVSAGIKQIDQNSMRGVVIEEADRALYDAKNAGRNRIAIAA